MQSALQVNGKVHGAEKGNSRIGGLKPCCPRSCVHRERVDERMLSQNYERETSQLRFTVSYFVNVAVREFFYSGHQQAVHTNSTSGQRVEEVQELY